MVAAAYLRLTNHHRYQWYRCSRLIYVRLTANGEKRKQRTEETVQAPLSTGGLGDQYKEDKNNTKEDDCFRQTLPRRRQPQTKVPDQHTSPNLPACSSESSSFPRGLRWCGRWLGQFPGFRHQLSRALSRPQE